MLIDPTLAQFATTSHTVDALLTGADAQYHTRKVMLTGGVLLPRGAVLGFLLASALAAAVATNVGNGAISAPTVRDDAVAGAYRVACVAAAANGGTFAVSDPTGAHLGTAAVGAAFAGPIGFTIADGAADFVVGDTFLVAVAAPTVAKLANAAASDGSAVPQAILVLDTDATAGDVEALVYATGEFNATAMTYGPGHSVDTIREPLRRRGITLRVGLSAFDGFVTA